MVGRERGDDVDTVVTYVKRGVEKNMRCFDEHLSVFHKDFKRFNQGVIGLKKRTTLTWWSPT